MTTTGYPRSAAIRWSKASVPPLEQLVRLACGGGERRRRAGERLRVVGVAAAGVAAARAAAAGDERGPRATAPAAADRRAARELAVTSHSVDIRYVIKSALVPAVHRVPGPRESPGAESRISAVLRDHQLRLAIVSRCGGAADQKPSDGQDQRSCRESGKVPSSADIERAREFAREPFLLDGEGPEALAPGDRAPPRPRRRAGRARRRAPRTPRSSGAATSRCCSASSACSPRRPPKLRDGAELNPHQVDALSGTLAELMAEQQERLNGERRTGNGDGSAPPAATKDERRRGRREADGAEERRRRARRRTRRLAAEEEPQDWERARGRRGRSSRRRPRTPAPSAASGSSTRPAPARPSPRSASSRPRAPAAS